MISLSEYTSHDGHGGDSIRIPASCNGLVRLKP